MSLSESKVLKLGNSYFYAIRMAQKGLVRAVKELWDQEQKMFPLFRCFHVTSTEHL